MVTYFTCMLYSKLKFLTFFFFLQFLNTCVLQVYYYVTFINYIHSNINLVSKQHTYIKNGYSQVCLYIYLFLRERKKPSYWLCSSALFCFQTVTLQHDIYLVNVPSVIAGTPCGIRSHFSVFRQSLHNLSPNVPSMIAHNSLGLQS